MQERVHKSRTCIMGPKLAQLGRDMKQRAEGFVSKVDLLACIWDTKPWAFFSVCWEFRDAKWALCMLGF